MTSNVSRTVSGQLTSIFSTAKQIVAKKSLRDGQIDLLTFTPPLEIYDNSMITLFIARPSIFPIWPYKTN